MRSNGWDDVTAACCVQLDNFDWMIPAGDVVEDAEMEKFVLVPEVCPVVSMTNVAEPMFGPTLSEVYSPVVLAGGGGGGLLRHTPWQW